MRRPPPAWPSEGEPSDRRRIVLRLRVTQTAAEERVPDALEPEHASLRARGTGGAERLGPTAPGSGEAALHCGGPQDPPMPADPKPSIAGASSPAVRAARAARTVAGDEEAGGDPARRDGFATLLYGLATGFALSAPAGAEPPELPERVATLAVELLRQALGQGFREATRTVDAIADALAEASPDPALLGLVHAGVAAAGDWIDGERGSFEARVLQATAGESFASGRPLLPR